MPTTGLGGAGLSLLGTATTEPKAAAKGLGGGFMDTAKVAQEQKEEEKKESPFGITLPKNETAKITMPTAATEQIDTTTATAIKGPDAIVTSKDFLEDERIESLIKKWRDQLKRNEDDF